MRILAAKCAPKPSRTANICAICAFDLHRTRECGDNFVSSSADDVAGPTPNTIGEVDDDPTL